jgi:hypothetical protein
MMELLLARMNANIKEHMQDMLARTDTHRKEDQEEMKDLLVRLEAKMEANQAKTDIKLKETSEKSNLAKLK